MTVVALFGALLAGASVRPSGSIAQDEPAAPLVDAVLDPMPLAPSFIRLIRITMAPGSSIPMRSHPGPKIDRVESGTLTATVRDADNLASVTVGGADESGVTGGEDVKLNADDVIVLPADTFYAFRNDGDEPVVLLSTIMLPAGHQRPPGITYADGEPPSDAYDGVTNQILGDGVATTLPTAPGRLVIDEVTVTPDQPLAATTDVTLLSNTGNGVAMTVDGGRVQVSRTVAPGPQRDSAVDAAYTLIAGDGIFFPEGHDAIAVPEGELAFIRITLTGGPSVDSGASTGADGTPAAGTPAAVETTTGDATPAAAGAPSAGTGAITISSVGSGPTDTSATPLPASSRPPRPSPTDAPATEPTEAATEAPSEAPLETPSDAGEPTAQPTEASGSAGNGGAFPIGSTVATTDSGVNVRVDPAADAEVVFTADETGTRFVVIGEPGRTTASTPGSTSSRSTTPPSAAGSPATSLQAPKPSSVPNSSLNAERSLLSGSDRSAFRLKWTFESHLGKWSGIRLQQRPMSLFDVDRRNGRTPLSSGHQRDRPCQLPKGQDREGAGKWRWAREVPASTFAPHHGASDRLRPPHAVRPASRPGRRRRSP